MVQRKSQPECQRKGKRNESSDKRTHRPLSIALSQTIVSDRDLTAVFLNVYSYYKHENPDHFYLVKFECIVSGKECLWF